MHSRFQSPWLWVNIKSAKIISQSLQLTFVCSPIFPLLLGVGSECGTKHRRRLGTIKMNDAMKKRMEELADENCLKTNCQNLYTYKNDCAKGIDFKAGFTAATDLYEAEIEKLEKNLKITMEVLEKIERLSDYAGAPTKEISEYLIKQAGIKSREIAKEALEKIRGSK